MLLENRGVKDRLSAEARMAHDLKGETARTCAIRFVRAFVVSLVLIALPFPSAAADKAAAGRTKADCARTAERFLMDRLAVWQSRLRLDDWKISIVMTNGSLLRPNTLGNVRWDADEKSAVIRVLDAADYQVGCREMLEDMEFTVVHELLHLELSTLPRSEASRRDEEFAVNHIATALLSLDRRR
jgi:hypothetical protein